MLSTQQIDIIIETLKPFNPTKIGIFGSVARGEDMPDSDIDILYNFRDTVGLFKLVKLKNELENRLNKKVDLIAEKYTHPRLKPQILNELKIIYGS